MKKFLVIFILLFTLVGCTEKGDYIPTAIVSNIDYDSNTLDLEFQLEIVDKAGIVGEVKVQLVSKEETISKIFNDNQQLYAFNNVLNNEEYSIKVLASYTVNDVLLEDKEILNFDITNYVSAESMYFPSQTYLYTGEKYSIYLVNVNDSYKVTYKGNEQSEVGIHEVTAEVYSNNKLIDTLTAYLVITQNKAELNVSNKTYEYTSYPINIEYQVSNNAPVDITYFDSDNNILSSAPTEVGVYNVELILDKQKQSVTMVIIKADIEILSMSKTVEYDGQAHGIDVITNIPCNSTITYNGSEVAPSEAGIYEVIISVEDTNNINGCIKYLTLTIDEESSYLNELFISQIIFINDDEVYIEIYNPTNSEIELSNYKIVLGNILNNKTIELSGSVKSYETFSIVSSDISLSNNFNLTSDYLVVSNNETISLYSNFVVDEFVLNNNLNYIRNMDVNKPSGNFNSNEWTISNSITSINTHICKKELVNYTVSFKNKNYINVNEEVNLNDHIIVLNNNIKVDITDDMIISNNININEFGQYTVSFIIENFEFDVTFIVSDIEAPIFKTNNTSLVFNINEEIDYLSLISVTDNTSNNINVIFEHNVDITKEGVYSITYYAYDDFDNYASYKIYIFIES